MSTTKISTSAPHYIMDGYACELSKIARYYDDTIYYSRVYYKGVVIILKISRVVYIK